MTTQIKYGKRCRNMSLGRNRFINTTGLDIMPSGDELILYPIDSRGNSSNACQIPVAMTAVPELADALIAAATPTLHDQIGFWPPGNVVALRNAIRRIVAAYHADEESGLASYDDELEAAIVAAGDLVVVEGVQ